MEEKEKKSYFFMFLEGYGTEEELMETVFTTFSGRHSDTEVKIFRPEHPEFERWRTKLEVRRLPGFAIADEKEPQPFISFDRGSYLIEKLKDEGREFYELIGDLHYSLIDESLILVDKKMAYSKLTHIFGKEWEEVKDLVTAPLWD